MIEPPKDLFSNYYYKENWLFSTYQWKKLSFYSGFILFTLIIFINCSTFQKKAPEETVEFSEPLDSKGFFKPSDKRALTLLEFVKELEEKSQHLAEFEPITVSLRGMCSTAALQPLAILFGLFLS